MATDAVPSTLPVNAADPATPVPPTNPPPAGAPLPPPGLPAVPGYAIHGEIARGGMGAVLRAEDSRLGRELAVKVLLDRCLEDPALVARFVAEAKLQGQLQHPGIVPVHELGEYAPGRPFFSMKLVGGQTLAALLQARPTPRQDLPRFVQWFEQVCQAVAYAHAQGVIHRDLKPGNVMVGAFGEVQVMDWGLAKVVGTAHPPDPAGAGAWLPTAGDDVAATRDGAILGTPAYMAPEQACGDIPSLDARTDVFALGALL
jgi:serine/threonine protein kinase